MDLMALARNGDGEAFAALTGPLRPELQLHCYRILGSLHDAEDALQETTLAAWKAFPRFEERSLRAWLYRIATNRCLNMLRASARRPRAAEPMHDVELPEPSRLGEVLWLEPYPDSLLEGIADDAPGPEARYESREATSLAFVTAMQLLPPRQRAVLILRDVLGYQASETAEMLASSEESVTSALKRARATLKAASSEGALPAPAPRSVAERALVERFVRAFESSDVKGVVSLLTDEVRFTMPPLPAVWQGRDRAGLFLDAMVAWSAKGHRVLQTRANGQPAVGIYVADPHGSRRHGVGLLVLTLAGEHISAITRFEPGMLERFGLPRTVLEEDH
jgi:RNA polymerase sigma-70 factor (ECF subfamily)